MLKLMRHLKDRVTDEDKQQIEDLLERVRQLMCETQIVPLH
jgi:hypothetical protein